MSDSVKRKCPECGKLALKRLIGTGSAVIFKGGGFHETDYRSDSYKKGAEAEKKATESKADDKKKEKVSDKKSTKTEKPSTKTTEPKSTKKSPGED
jgi:predicted nucleic acid-binding Zn ribbon protein